MQFKYGDSSNALILLKYSQVIFAHWWSWSLNWHFSVWIQHHTKVFSHWLSHCMKIPYIHRHIWYLRLIYFFVPRMLYCVEQLLYTTNWVSYCLFFKGNHFIRCSTLYTGKIYFPCLEITETPSIWHANMLVSLSKYV